ncbi:MAG: C39 family peptidase [Candidatus Aenigmarchaeota archaeon]|nr:C39 family peptidase [Candidatus Aenigmarchaeota archaeon]
MKVPYYKQEFWYSCFATCAKMVLEYYGIRKSEHDLRILLKATPVHGTIWEIAEREIKAIGFELIHKRHMSYDELANLVKLGIPVIVSIDIEQEKKNMGHVGVVTDIRNDTVVFHDPERGIVTYKKMELLRLWNKRRNKAGYLKPIQ